MERYTYGLGDLCHLVGTHRPKSSLEPRRRRAEMKSKCLLLSRSFAGVAVAVFFTMSDRSRFSPRFEAVGGNDVRGYQMRKGGEPVDTNSREFSIEELVGQETTVFPARHMMQTIGVTLTVSATLTVTGLPGVPALPVP